MSTIDVDITCPACSQEMVLPVELDDATELLAELIEHAERQEQWATLQTQTLRRLATKLSANE